MCKIGKSRSENEGVKILGRDEISEVEREANDEVDKGEDKNGADDCNKDDDDDDNVRPFINDDLWTHEPWLGSKLISQRDN